MYNIITDTLRGKRTRDRFNLILEAVDIRERNMLGEIPDEQVRPLVTAIAERYEAAVKAEQPALSDNDLAGIASDQLWLANAADVSINFDDLDKAS